MTDSKNSVDPDKRDVEGLTEVLRLQAEALSRISERMAGMNQSGAKAPPRSSEKINPGDGMNLPALAGDPALNEESLPVLNSFKKFLDQERRRGRKRFIWGLIGFTVMFAVVLAIIVKMNSARVHDLKEDIQQTSLRLDRSQQEAGAEIKKMADTAALSVEKNAANMRSDITRNILWAHSALTSNMNSVLIDRDTEIERLKEKISAMEVDNTMLSRQVADLVQRVKIIEMDYLDNMERGIADSRSANSNAADHADSNLASSVGRSAPLTINSARYGRSVQMRVPKE